VVAQKSLDWFQHNKVDTLTYNAIPNPGEHGRLPRTLAGYTLLSIAPQEGKEYRDGQHVLYMEEKTRNRRLRIFSVQSTIFRVQALTRVTELPDEHPDHIKEHIKRLYGDPHGEIMNEYVYLDSSTVLVFKFGGDFLITDLMDSETCELPPHIYELIDTFYEVLP
jgi:hypothetical protein